MLCEVFNSRRKADTYLYLPLGTEYHQLPEALQQQFGTPNKVLTVNLATRDRLARISTKELIEHLTEAGYYLQLPPKQESLL